MITIQALIVVAFIIFLVALTWYNELFAKQEYNKLAGALLIFIIIWFLSIVFRFIFASSDFVTSMEANGSDELVYTPEWSKCLFGQPKCEQSKFTWWTILHIIMYAIVGYLVPGLYIEVLIISVAFEMIEYGVGYPAKFVLDPTANLIGYFIGSTIAGTRA